MGLTINSSNPLSIYKFDDPSVSIIWKWKNGYWKAWSPKKDIIKLIKDHNIKTIEYLYPYEGFWLKAKNDDSVPISQTTFELLNIPKNISIYDPISIKFSLPLSDVSMHYKKIALIDTKNKTLIDGKTNFDKNDNTLYFFPNSRLSKGQNYRLIVDKSILSSSKQQLAKKYDINITTLKQKKPIEIFCEKDYILPKESVNFYFKTYLNTAKITTVKWFINDQEFDDENISYTFLEKGVYDIRVKATDNFGREFEDNKKIYVFDDLSKSHFAKFGKMFDISQNLDIIEQEGDPLLFQALSNYSGQIKSIYKINFDKNSTVLNYFGRVPSLLFQMPSKNLKQFISNYADILKEQDRLIGFANFYGFFALLSYREVNNITYLDILFENGGVDIDTMFNGYKVSLYDKGVSKIPTAIKLSFAINSNSISSLKGVFGKDLNKIEHLKYIIFSNRSILYEQKDENSANARVLNRALYSVWGSAWSYVSDTTCSAAGSICGSGCSEGCQEAADTIEEFATTVFNYFSQDIIDTLNSIQDTYNNVIKNLSVFDNIGNLKTKTVAIKDNLHSLYTNYSNDAQNIFNQATDPDKITDKLKSFLVEGDPSVKSVVKSFKDSIQGSFATVSNILLDKISGDLNTTQTELNNFLQDYLPQNDMNLEFEVLSDSSVNINAKYANQDISISLNTLQSVLDTNWSSLIGLDVSNLENKLQNFKNNLGDNFAGTLGFYYYHNSNPLLNSLQMDIIFKNYNDNLLSFVATLKPTNPNISINLNAPNTSTSLGFEFSPYSLPEPVLASNMDQNFTELEQNLTGSFLNSFRPFPNGKITLNTNFLGKYALNITSELFPKPRVSQAVKIGGEATQYLGVGGGVEVAAQAGISLPLYFDATMLYNSLQIIKNILNDLQNSDPSYYFQPSGFCLLLDNIRDNFLNNPNFQNLLSDIGVSLDFGASGKLGVGAGGSEGGGSASVTLNGGVSMGVTFLSFDKLLSASTSQCIFSPNTYTKFIADNFPLSSIKTIPSMFINQIQNSYSDALFSAFAEDFSTGISVGLQEEVQANLAAGVDASISQSISFSLNGEWILNLLYKIYSLIGIEGIENFKDKYDHETIYPVISFAFSQSGEMEYGLDIGFEAKGVTNISFPLFQGSLTILSNPILNDIQSDTKLSILPYVSISTQDSSTKNALFESNITTEATQDIANFRWNINGKDVQVGHIVGIGNILQISKDKLKVTFDKKGKYLIALEVTDTQGKQAVSLPLTYQVINTPPKKPVLNVENNETINLPYDITFSSYDSDGDNIEYIVKLATDTNFQNIIDTKTTSDESYTLYDKNGTLYLSVKAYDGEDYSDDTVVKININSENLAQKYKVLITNIHNSDYYFIDDNISFEIDTPNLFSGSDDGGNGNYFAEIEIARDKNFTQIVKTLGQNYNSDEGWLPFDPCQINEEGTYYIRAKLKATNDNFRTLSTSDTVSIEVNYDEDLLLHDQFDTYRAINSWDLVTPHSGTYTIESSAGYYHYKRANSSNGDITGIKKDLSLDISTCSEVYIDFDIKLAYSNMTDSGSWSYNNGGIGEFPAMIKINFTDTQDKSYVWNIGFLDRDDHYDRSNYVKIPLNEWYHYSSPNLVNEKTTQTKAKNVPIQSGTIHTIKQIFLGGIGHSFEGYIDNLMIRKSGCQ